MEEVGVVQFLDSGGVLGGPLFHPSEQGAAEDEPSGADGGDQVRGGRNEQGDDRADRGESKRAEGTGSPPAVGDLVVAAVGEEPVEVL
ncbi:hypothetical protein FHG89_24420 [Micromonospora orduensis]|uniref:Uncharacterized protein n=1 Tax=Micromonospora orduensis TaxID=1420891 RepID=A0A5C4QEP5_9ACTN|nr:hypothetical protein FHG89_24420 [Micromonospora orduensis]